MNLLGTDAYRTELGQALSVADKRVWIISAFLTRPGVEWVADRINRAVREVRILTRWRLSDLVTGASDLDAYEEVTRRGWSMFIAQDLHAKAVLVDQAALFVGSANITGKGLELVPGGNREIGVSLQPTPADVHILSGLFDDATVLTSSLFEMIEECVDRCPFPVAPQPPVEWPHEIASRMSSAPERLWVHELFWCATPSLLVDGTGVRADFSSGSDPVIHDRMLLGLARDTTLSLDAIRDSALRSRAVHWLIGQLRAAPNNEMYFGGLSSALHNSLLDDPVPYRRTVKELLQHLIAWLEEIPGAPIAVDRPSHSQRVRLVSH